MTASNEVWIGMVHVRTTPSSVVLADSSGGWVNVLAWAQSPDEYRSQIFHAVAYYGLELRSIEDIEPLRLRLEKASVEPLLDQRAKEVEVTRMVRFGTFHTYLETT